MPGIEAYTAPVTMTTGTDHWFAVVSTGSSLKFIVDGVLKETLSFSMRLFNGVTLTDLIATIADAPYVGRPSDGTARTSNTDARRERMWQRALTLSEVTAEAASSTPIITSGLLSNVGLTSNSDLTDTVAGRDFSATNPFYSSSPTSSGDGYIRFGAFSDGVRRSAPFFNASLPFTLLWHNRFSATGETVDLRMLAKGTDFTAPYIYVGGENLEIYLLVYTGETGSVPQIPLDTTTPCCGGPTTSGGGVTSTTGDILPVVDPTWTPACTDSGTVPTASDLSDPETWRTLVAPTPCFRFSLTLAKYPAANGSTTYYWSTRPLADAGAFTEGRLNSIGAITRSVMDQNGNVMRTDVTLDVSDDDGLLRGLLDKSAQTQFFAGREGSIELLSEAGRAASASWSPRFRGVVTKIQPLPGRRASLTLTDLVGSRFSASDLDKTIGVPIGDEHTALPDESRGKIYPYIVGEHSDLGSTDINGESAEKGLLPIIDTGDYFIDGTTDPVTHLSPPTNLQAVLVGSGSGSYTRHYAVTAGNASGESRMSATVSVSGCPSEFDGSTYVALTWDAVTGATFYRVCGRSANPPTTWLDGMNNGGTYVSPETAYNDDDDRDVEKGLPDLSVSTAVDDGVWGRFVVSIGVTDIHDVFGTNAADATEPKRVKVDPALDGVEYLIPSSADWPHADPYIELGGIRQTVIYLRGHLLHAHRKGEITVALTGCGMESTGDGTGTMVGEAFKAGQLFINEHILKDGGTGYRTGDYGPLETFSNGDAQLWTSKWAAAQTLSASWIGGTGYKAAWAIHEPITVREFFRRFCVSFDCRLAVNHFGQIYPVLLNPGASPSTGALYREREEGVSLVADTFADDELENRLTYSYDRDSDAQAYRVTDLTVEDAASIAAHVPGGVSGDADPRGVYEPSPLELYCVRDPDTADDVIARRLARNRKTPRYVTVEQDAVGLDTEIGDQIRLTHRDGIGTSGDVETPICVLEHTIEHDASGRVLVTRITGIDMGRIAAGFPS